MDTNKPLRVLIANRAEIALRIQSTLLALGHIPLGLHTAKEGPNAPHLRYLPADSRLQIPGDGAKAYLDIPSLIKVAKAASADAVVPGYGFLSESPEFAAAVISAGMLWVGPKPDTLRLFGDKYESKAFADRTGVPVLRSTSADASLEEINAFARSLPRGSKVLLKALEGGGGRGIRVVHDPTNPNEIKDAYESCRREAAAAFASDKVFAEPFLDAARHIEVQILGDGKGGAKDVGERECTLQRRHQKLIELCPSPTLVHLPELRRAIITAAIKLASEGKLLSLATFEFLVSVPPPGSKEPGLFYFLECNPRLQVEHTVTEEAYGLDLVAAQLHLALGAPLGAVLPPPIANTTAPVATRAALQLRLNAERLLPDGTAVGTAGRLTTFVPPSGRGVRLDTAAHPPLPPPVGSYVQSLDFDSLLAKIILTGPDYTSTVAAARRALIQLKIGGVGTNRALLLALCEEPRVVSNQDISTRFVELNATALFSRVHEIEKEWAAEEAAARSADPGPEDSAATEGTEKLPPVAPGQAYITTHLAGKVVSVALDQGSRVQKGDTVAILESMKMEHTVRSELSGTVVNVLASEGDGLGDGAAILLLQVEEDGSDTFKSAVKKEAELDPDAKTPAQHELDGLRAELKDDSPVRALATKRRKDRGFRTARENLEHLVDEGSWIEFGELALAAQQTRLSPQKLAATRGDGVLVGWGRVNGHRCAVVMCDYGVLAGTQGYFHHIKLDRIFASVLADPAPVVLFAEGGGGRPGDVDTGNTKVAGLNTPSFGLLARIVARGIPVIGVANGYVFAGNAALLGCADVVIATDAKGTSIGMGGPAMIEGGGLGVFHPDDVGPVRRSHMTNGNVDIVVNDEAEATNVARHLVSFFSGRGSPPVTPTAPAQPLSDAHWYTQDPRRLRHAIPADRRRAYSMHALIDMLSDDGMPFLEIGAGWGASVIVGFIRVQGWPLAIMASNVNSPLGGAIDAASARKGTRFLNLMAKSKAAHVLALCDTPGFMVGPAAEPEGGLRAFAEYFAAGASLSDAGGRVFGLTIRRAYGLGAQALLGGSTLAPFHSAAWPAAEFAGMGIEGAVRLGMRAELAAIDDEEQRKKAEQQFIDEMYARGRAVNMARMLEIDSVIDPAETRDWLVRCMASVAPRPGVASIRRQLDLGAKL